VVAQVRQFQQRFRVANEGPEVTTRLLALLREVPTCGRRIHDANIVATMLVYGVRRLRTNNPDDFVPFAALIDVLPLVTPLCLWHPQTPDRPPDGRRAPPLPVLRCLASLTTRLGDNLGLCLPFPL
jgi:hypothetical protein